MSRDDEAAREIRTHLETEAEELVEAGMSETEARYAARRAFGSVARTREDVHAVWARVWIDDARQDAAFAVRMLVRSPSFAIAAVVTLALGIGATSAIFSVVNSVLLQPLPYADPERLVEIVENVPAAESPSGAPMRLSSMNQDEFDWWRTRTTTLSHMAILINEARTMSTPDGTVRLASARVSPALFPMLGVQPVIGRWLRADEERPDAAAVVLSAAAWQRYLASDPEVIDRAVVLDGRSHTVAGVMPPEFDLPSADTEVWMPFAIQPPRPGVVSIVRVVSRLRDGVPIESAATEANVLGHQLRGFEPQPGEAARFEVTRLQDRLVAPVRPALHVLAAAVGIVLLIVCANVANLLLARSSVREQEIGIRRALGAGRLRIVRQAITECLVLSLAGGALGLLIAYGGVHLLKALAMVDTPALFRRAQPVAFARALLPRVGDVVVDSRVLTFAVAIAILTALVFGVAPALRMASIGTGSGDNELPPATMVARAGRHRTARTLAVLQMAMATMLLVGASLLMHSFVRLSRVDPGFEPEGVVHFQLVLPQEQAVERKLEAGLEIAARLGRLSGVEAAGFTNSPPFENLSINASILPPGMSDDEYLAIPRRERPQTRTVSAGYLQAIGARLVEGRWIDASDGPGQPRVALVNRAYARRYLPGNSAVGALLRQGVSLVEVVGVVDDLKLRTLDGESEPVLFAETRQWMSTWGPQAPGGGSFLVGPSGAMSFAVRVAGNPLSIAADVRGIVAQVDSAAAVEGLARLDSIVAGSIARPRLYAVLLTIFGVIAATVAAIGVYGVLAYAVVQRTREFGIRLALGAPPRDVLRLVLRQGVTLAAIGIVLGVAGAAALARYLSGLLFGVSAGDVPTYAAAAVGFAVVALLASYLPARRATRVDPLTALRAE